MFNTVYKSCQGITQSVNRQAENQVYVREIVHGSYMRDNKRLVIIKI